MSAVIDLASRRAPLTPAAAPASAPLAVTTVDRIVRMPEAVKRSGLSIATIYRRCRAGDFPPKISLGGTSVGFRESDFSRWLAERDQAGAP